MTTFAKTAAIVTLSVMLIPAVGLLFAGWWAVVGVLAVAGCVLGVKEVMCGE